MRDEQIQASERPAVTDVWLRSPLQMTGPQHEQRHSQAGGVVDDGLEIAEDAVTRGWATAVGSWCALVGGLCWVIKGGWILALGWQPQMIYEVAPLFFAAAAGALFALPVVRSRSAKAGLAAASIAELAAVISVLGLYLGPPHWRPTASTVTVLTPWITLSALGTFVSLVLLGVPVRRARALPGWSRNLPLAIGIGAIPALAVGGLLEMLKTHLLEVSTVAVGLAWVMLAVALRRHAALEFASRRRMAPS